jgi:hypothetical protein
MGHRNKAVYKKTNLTIGPAAGRIEWRERMKKQVYKTLCRAYGKIVVMDKTGYVYYYMTVKRESSTAGAQFGITRDGGKWYITDIRTGMLIHGPDKFKPTRTLIDAESMIESEEFITWYSDFTSRELYRRMVENFERIVNAQRATA